LSKKDAHLMRLHRLALRFILVIAAVSSSPGSHAVVPEANSAVGGKGSSARRGGGGVQKNTGGNQGRQSGANRTGKSGAKRDKAQESQNQMRRQNARKQRGQLSGMRTGLRRRAQAAAATGATTATLSGRGDTESTSGSAVQAGATGTAGAATTRTVTVSPFSEPQPKAIGPAQPAPESFRERLAELPQGDREKLAGFYQAMTPEQRRQFQKEMEPLSPEQRAVRLTEMTGVVVPAAKAAGTH
jgi:hypothetical protein